MKICPTCGEDRPDDRGYCDSCQDTYHKEYRSKNKEKIANYYAEWYRNNKELRAKSRSAWSEKNKERMVIVKMQYTQKYYESQKLVDNVSRE